MFQMSFLNNVAKAVAFVSGGASGLGAATVKHLIKNGAKVALFDLPTASESADKLAAELQPEQRDNYIYLPGNVTDDQSIKDALLTTEDKFEPLNLNVNCAGIYA